MYREKRFKISDSRFKSIDYRRKSVALVTGPECVSCGLCARICPVGGIRMEKLINGIQAEKEIFEKYFVF
mgnify:CR=1 FL=1